MEVSLIVIIKQIILLTSETTVVPLKVNQTPIHLLWYYVIKTTFRKTLNRLHFDSMTSLPSSEQCVVFGGVRYHLWCVEDPTNLVTS